MCFSVSGQMLGEDAFVGRRFDPNLECDSLRVNEFSVRLCEGDGLCVETEPLVRACENSLSPDGRSI